MVRGLKPLDSNLQIRPILHQDLSKNPLTSEGLCAKTERIVPPLFLSMNEQRIEAYLSLIQPLPATRTGEEGLVQAYQQVAAQLWEA